MAAASAALDRVRRWTPGRGVAVLSVLLGSVLAVTASGVLAAQPRNDAGSKAPVAADGVFAVGSERPSDAPQMQPSDPRHTGFGLDGLDGLIGRGELHQDVPGSPCLTELDARSRPSAVLVGEAVSTTLELELLCRDLERRAIHIVLLVDGSGSMAGQPSAEMKAGLARFVRELDLPSNPHIKMGVVEFNSRAKTLCQLTNQDGRVIGCTNKVGANGGTELHRGIEEAGRVLVRGRAEVRPAPHEILVIVSDIEVGQDCATARARANSLKSEGVRIVTICLGLNCHTQCLRDVASSTADAHTSIDFSIDAVVDGLVREVLDAFAWSVEIEIDVDPRLQWLGVSPNLANLPNQPLYDPVRQQAWIKWHFPTQDDTAEIRFDAVAPGTFVPFTVRRAEVVSPGGTVSIPVSVGYLMALSPSPVQP